MILIGIATYIALGLLSSEAACVFLGKRLPTIQYVLLTLLWLYIVPKQLWLSYMGDDDDAA